MGSSNNKEEEQKISQSQRNFRSHNEIFAVIAKICTAPMSRQNSAQCFHFYFILFLFLFKKTVFFIFFIIALFYKKN